MKNELYRAKKIQDISNNLKCTYVEAYTIMLLEEISYKLYLLTKDIKAEKTGTKES